MVKDFKISNKKICSSAIPFLIAEIGVNHDGSIEKAKKMINVAKAAGADCVKFQTYNPVNLVSLNAKKAPYQIKNTKKNNESQFQMLKKLRLSYSDHKELIKHCKKKKILFLSTPYNFDDVEMLNRLKVPAFKLASMHLSEPAFIEHVAKKKKPVIISTGMSEFSEIKIAVKILKKYLKNKFILMQCTTNYPADYNEANIKVIMKFKDFFNCHVGYSDHTLNNVSAIAATSFGAVAIEKHFTLNKNLKGPDHKCSLSPLELSNFISDIKCAKICLGKKEKTLSSGEKKNIKFMKRSIYTKKLIKKGQIISIIDLEFKRPATGISSSKANQIVGKVAKKDIPANNLLNKKHINIRSIDN